MKKTDHEKRLIDFTVDIIKISDSGYDTHAGNSPVLHYREAQHAESKNDFMHKLRIIL